MKKAKPLWYFPFPTFFQLLAVGFILVNGFYGQYALGKGPSDFNGVTKIDSESIKMEIEKLLKKKRVLLKLKRVCKCTSLFLEERDFPLPNQTALELSLQISKGCTGSSARFKKIYSIFKATGIDFKKCIEAGIKFAYMTDSQVDNFIEIFPQAYMKDFFDLDFMLALNLATKLAQISNGPISQIRADFTEITQFCLSEKNLNLPITTCAELAVFLAEQSQYFPKGLSKLFIEEFNYLRKHPQLNLTISKSLSVLKEVFSYGPLAPLNFREGLNYSFSSPGLNKNTQSSLSLALALAKNSNKSFPPPIFEETPIQK